MARIEIRRKKQWADALRTYEVELDGSIVGEFKRGETFGHELSAGKHSLKLRIDWASSNSVDFDIFDDQTLQFECGNNAPPFLELVYVTFLRHKYLWLKRLNGDT